MGSSWSSPSLQGKCLNGEFGNVVEAPFASHKDLVLSSSSGADLRLLWLRYGVLALRGLDNLTPQDLVSMTQHLGKVSPDIGAGREHARLAPNLPVLRIGNVKNEKDELISVPSSSRNSDLPPSGSCQYRPDERKPVWHTDGTFAQIPPAGSVLFCKQAPPTGAETCFADMAAAYERALSDEERAHLESLECICSQAHHDKKLNLTQPTYPTLTPEQRAAAPPQRVPVVLTHPETGRKALYGINSSTCAVVPKGSQVSQEEMDRYDLEGLEDDSVSVLRNLLPRLTTPEFTIVWKWRQGDVLIWDNRSTIHCPTGYNQDLYIREMWRTTILP